MDILKLMSCSLKEHNELICCFEVPENVSQLGGEFLNYGLSGGTSLFRIKLLLTQNRFFTFLIKGNGTGELLPLDYTCFHISHLLNRLFTYVDNSSPIIRALNSCISDSNFTLLEERNLDELTVMLVLKKQPQLLEFIDNPIMFVLLVYYVNQNGSIKHNLNMPRHLLLNTLFDCQLSKKDIKRWRELNLTGGCYIQLMAVARALLQYPDIFVIFKSTGHEVKLSMLYTYTHLYDANFICIKQHRFDQLPWVFKFLAERSDELEVLFNHFRHIDDVLAIYDGLNEEDTDDNQCLPHQRKSNLIDELRSMSLNNLLKRLAQLFEIYNNMLAEKESEKLASMPDFVVPAIRPDNIHIFSIKTPKGLLKEGIMQCHCVASYMDKVERRQVDIYIYNDPVKKHRGTLEIVIDPQTNKPVKIGQFLAKNNQPMPDEAKAYVKNWYKQATKLKY